MAIETTAQLGLMAATAPGGSAAFLAALSTAADASPGGSLGLTISVIVALLVGGGLGALLYRLITSSTVAKARAEAEQLLETTRLKAEHDARENELEAAREIAAKRKSAEAELDRSRQELRESERRLDKRDTQLEKAEGGLERERERLAAKLEEAEQREALAAAAKDELETVLSEQRERLLSLSGMTAEHAKQQVLEQIEADCQDEAAAVVRRVKEQTDREVREQATEILTSAVQRYSTEVTSESTVRAVPIPSDEMKGRIIGREGRNIRAIEAATGVDIIVDDTPGVIVVSCFDKIRQATAVEALQRLIKDGRMHPTRIEEVVEKVRGEIDERVVQAGKDAATEAHIRGLHPKLVNAMGKLHYRSSHGQNVLRHSIEVAFLSQLIADQLGLDGTLARRCGFLHDIGKAMDQEQEGTHPAIGMAYAKQHGEKDPVLNVIGGHHGDIPSTNFYTPIVMAADAISSARPGARRESMEHYIKRLNELQDIAREHKGVREAYAVQAGREVRVMVDAKQVSDDRAVQIASQIADRVSREMTFPGEIRVTVLRETRAVEYAR
ncbi:MAG: ribonuclease Y [Planctomycetota bacterium]